MTRSAGRLDRLTRTSRDKKGEDGFKAEHLQTNSIGLLTPEGPSRLQRSIRRSTSLLHNGSISLHLPL
ncbi:hypothetical protein EYF80_047743 [Liparis tanakae]|uniref:Uncharacterized protein n=1 Tax=Liparis tanakae TaxID=230148 RepID=A0A4Z2FLT4_9TELE|nr:hypothetical protein EYF80_047743 [Liparis tanakae]